MSEPCSREWRFYVDDMIAFREGRRIQRGMNQAQSLRANFTDGASNPLAGVNIHNFDIYACDCLATCIQFNLNSSARPSRCLYELFTARLVRKPIAKDQSSTPLSRGMKGNHFNHIIPRRRRRTMGAKR